MFCTQTLKNIEVLALARKYDDDDIVVQIRVLFAQ